MSANSTAVTGETLKAYSDREWSLIMSMTQQMREAAEAGEWAKLLDLEPKRRALLGDFFSRPVDPENIFKVQENIKTIMRLDKIITEASQARRDELSAEQADVNHSRKAQKAYASNS